MSDALIASFRRLLESEIRMLKKAPQWMWEFEFSMHVWPLLERESRETTDESSQDLLEAIKDSQSVSLAVCEIEDYLDQISPYGPNKRVPESF